MNRILLSLLYTVLIVANANAQIKDEEAKPKYRPDKKREIQGLPAKEHPLKSIKDIKVFYDEKDNDQIRKIEARAINPILITNATTEVQAVKNFILQYGDKFKIKNDMSDLVLAPESRETVLKYYYLYKGYKVLDNKITFSLNSPNKITYVMNNINPNIKDRNLKQKLDAKAAEKIAQDTICGKDKFIKDNPEILDLSKVGTSPVVWVYEDIPYLVWEVAIVREVTGETHHLLVDAETGEVLRIRRIVY